MNVSFDLEISISKPFLKAFTVDKPTESKIFNGGTFFKS